MNKIEQWAKAIQKHEGFYAPNPKYPKGSASWRNNNPGNFRCSGLVMGEFGAIACKNNLAVFKTYDDGFRALVQFLTYAVNGELRYYKPTMTLLQFYQRYAPSSDNNSPLNYASAIAKDMGVSIDTTIRDMVGEAEPIPVEIKIENQLAYKGARFGVNNKSSVPAYGCKFLCVKYLYEIKLGKKVSIGELNDILVKGGAYYDGDLLIDDKIAKVLGFKFLGRETNIDKAPEWSPTMKEVRFSYGWGQHFVIRIINPDGSKKILDPYEGVERKINYYEMKCQNPLWKKPGFSYRKFAL